MTSAHPSVYQLPDQKQPSGPPASRQCLAAEGSHRAGHQHDFPRVQQLVVLGPKEDRKSAACNQSILSQPPHDSATLEDGDARVCPFSHQKSEVDDIDRHPRCLPSCSDAPGCQQVSTRCGQPASVPVHWSPLWVSEFSTRVHQAAAACRSAVKAARCEATRLLKTAGWSEQIHQNRPNCTPRQPSVCSSFSAGSSTTRNQTSFQVRTFPVHRDAVQHSTIHSGVPTKDVSQGPVRSSALDYRPEHHSQGSAQASRHVGVHGFAGTTEKTLSSPGPVVGRPSMVPEDRELVRLDPSSSVVSVRGGLVGISSSPARSTPRRQGDGSDSLQGCVQFGLGSPARLTLNTGTVVSISKIVAHQRSGDAGRHQCSERLPPTSEVPDSSLVVRQRSDCGLHQERGGTRSHPLMQLTIRLLKWCNRKAITLVPSICQECTASRWIPCPESARHWPRSGRWPWSVYDPCLPSGASRRSTLATFANRRLIKFMSPHPDPSAEWTDAMSMSWDNGRDLLYMFPPFKMVAQVLQKIAQSPGVRVILIAQLQLAALWFPELMDLSQQDPIPLYFEGQDLLTGDWDSSLLAVKFTRVETLRAILRAKGHSREAANMMSRCLRESSLQVYESHWSRFMAFCRTKRWHVFRVRSHHFSTYMMHLFRDGLLPSTIISHCTSVASVLCHWVYIKLLVRGFRLERPVQRRIMPKWNLHLVLLSLLRPPFASDGDEDGESSDDVIPLKWRTMKCVPVSIGFGKTALVPACIECRARQMCVHQRKHTATTCGISNAGTWSPSEESATDPGPWMDHRARDCPLESDRSGETAVSRETVEALHTGLGKNPGGRQHMFMHCNRNIRDIMRSHISRWIVETVKKAYTQADPEYDRVTAHEVRAFQLHGRTTVRWPYLTSCQQRFGGHLGSFRIRIYATWPVVLMACRHWVQWWLHNK